MPLFCCVALLCRQFKALFYFIIFFLLNLRNPRPSKKWLGAVMGFTGRRGSRRAASSPRPPRALSPALRARRAGARVLPGRGRRGWAGPGPTRVSPCAAPGVRAAARRLCPRCPPPLRFVLARPGAASALEGL